jgi:hypothetical protein
MAAVACEGIVGPYDGLHCEGIGAGAHDVLAHGHVKGRGRRVETDCGGKAEAERGTGVGAITRRGGE